MFSLLSSKKVRSWCLFDFGISSYPTLILTFFYGAFYAREIVGNATEGTSLWGFSISLASFICSIIFLIIITLGVLTKRKIKTTFFFIFYLILIITTSSLFFLNKDVNKYIPLLLIIISFIAFELVNLFYNLSLYKVSRRINKGSVSNLGWACGYSGGLISLFIVLLMIYLFKDTNFENTIFLLVGPFVGLWILAFGIQHLNNSKKLSFNLSSVKKILQDLKSNNLNWFLVSYFFFNNGVICIFSFASMIASFVFGLSEVKILFMGIFINFTGILGCLALGSIDDKIGSQINILLCILALILLTSGLYFIQEEKLFWLLALLIGFFIGPLQASSRSLISRRIRARNQLTIFSIYSLFGNICSILGPFVVGYVISVSESIRLGMLVIPFFLIMSLFPYIIKNR